MNTLLQIDLSELEYTLAEVSKAFYSFPVHIRILMGVTVLFILIVLVLLFIILSSRIYKTRRKNRRRAIQKKYQPVFMTLLFEDEQHILGNEFDTNFDLKDLRKSHNRKIIKDEIIHLHDNFTGETASRLELIFVKLDFHLDSLKMLKSQRWYLKAKGMRELALMNIKEAYKEVSHYLNHKNEILRMEARIAMMKLSDQHPLDFLNHIVEPLNDWDQSNIHAMLSKMPESSLPDFSQWLNSPNKSVVLFCIRMIGAFRQQDSVHVLTRILGHPDEKIKMSVIRTLKDLNASSTEETLVNMYPLESLSLQKEILITLGVIGKDLSARLMEKILKQPIQDYSIAIQAVRTLSSIAKDGQEKTDFLYSQGNPTLQLIIQHARDPRL